MTHARTIRRRIGTVGEGVTLLGSQEDSDYPSIFTRVAGIEMKWPAALINVRPAAPAPPARSTSRRVSSSAKVARRGAS